jgi:AcrR family transcriptional regulator
MKTSAATASEDGRTPLERQLAQAQSPPPKSALDAFRLARQRFLTGERIDMSALATELGVNRVTLYRWVGSRERLLVEVLWSLAATVIERERTRTRKRGAERIVQIVGGFIRAVLAEPAMTRFLLDEGDLAMRLLTRSDAGFQARLIDAIEGLLAEEVERGSLELPANLRDVAYTIVRIVESYIYLDKITGEEPDADRAEAMLRLLLR